MTNRVTLVRTQVAIGANPAEGSQLSAARTQVLTRARMGTPKRASVCTNVVFFPAVPSGGVGENSVHGYAAVATTNQHWNSYRVSGTSITVNAVEQFEYPPVLFENTTLPAGYSANGNFAALCAQIETAYPQDRVVYSFADNTGTTWTYTTIGPGNVLGSGVILGTTLRGLAWVTALTGEVYDYVPGAAFAGSQNNQTIWADPPPDGVQMALRGFRLQRRMNEDQSSSPTSDTTRINTISLTAPGGTVMRAVRGPGTPMVIRPGRGLYRVVKWNKGFVVRRASPGETLVPEFPGRTTDRYNEFVGRVFDGIDAFVAELLGRSYFVPGTPVDTRGWDLRYPTTVLGVPAGPYVYKGWCSLLSGPFVGDAQWNSPANRDVFDSGHYIATPRGNPIGADEQAPEVRFRRLKTVRVWPLIGAPTPAGRAFGLGTSTVTATGVFERCETFTWYPEGLPQPITRDVIFPEFWLEKLDSPSTNFLSTDPLVDP